MKIVPLYNMSPGNRPVSMVTAIMWVSLPSGTHYHGNCACILAA